MGVLVILVLIILYRSEKFVTINGFGYYVGDAEKAKTLAKINRTAIKVIEVLRNRLEKEHKIRGMVNGGAIDEITYLRLKDMYENLRWRYNPDGLKETVAWAIAPDVTSYTWKKGEVLSMCLEYDKQTETWPVLFTVLIHELTHMSTKVEQHPPEFWTRYKLLVDTVRESGMTKTLKLPKTAMVHCGSVRISRREMERLKSPAAW